MSDSKSSRKRIATHISGLPRSGIRDFFELVNAVKDVIRHPLAHP